MGEPMKRRYLMRDPDTGHLREATDHELATLPGPFYVDAPQRDPRVVRCGVRLMSPRTSEEAP